jgi:hypothetical protein
MSTAAYQQGEERSDLGKPLAADDAISDLASVLDY